MVTSRSLLCRVRVSLLELVSAKVFLGDVGSIPLGFAGRPSDFYCIERVLGTNVDFTAAFFATTMTLIAAPKTTTNLAGP